MVHALSFVESFLEPVTLETLKPSQDPHLETKTDSRCFTRSLAEPMITIGIPTYNRVSLLKGCVESALAQSYPNVEVVVSDNASTDDTLAFLQSIGHPRLRVLTNPTNVGAIANFDKCIREARGEYLVIACDDNVLDPAFLEKCVRLVRLEPGIPIVLAAYDVLVVDEFGQNERRVIPAKISRKLSTGVWDGTEIAREYLNGRISAQLLSSIVRTDILRRNGGFSKHPCAGDEGTWIPLLLEGRVGLVNERCATYMVHGSSLSERSSADERLRDLRAVMEEISYVAEQKISDRATRQEIQKLAFRYVAYLAMTNLVIYRRAGARLIDVIRKLGDWRVILNRCTFMDFLATAQLRTMGRILLPASAIRLAIRLGLDRRV
jgi:glycosyltransferase involved in cell wall biosynthesis